MSISLRFKEFEQTGADVLLDEERRALHEVLADLLLVHLLLQICGLALLLSPHLLHSPASSSL